MRQLMRWNGPRIHKRSTVRLSGHVTQYGATAMGHYHAWNKRELLSVLANESGTYVAQAWHQWDVLNEDGSLRSTYGSDATNTVNALIEQGELVEDAMNLGHWILSRPQRYVDP